MSTGSLIPRVYGNFKGVDFRGEVFNLGRSPDSVNMWRDYKEADSIRTRPGLDKVVDFSEPVYGLFFFRDMMLVHSGTKLYKVKDGATAVLFSGVMASASDSFVYEDVWYFKDGKYYLQYDGTTIKEVEGYIPTTSIGRKPAGGGTIHEDVNMLTGIRINTFLADNASLDFYLDAKNLDTDYAPIVKVNDAVVTNYTVDYTKGIIQCKAAPAAPKTDGQDNVSVQFRKTVTNYRNNILNCTLLQVFDNRVFFSGNKNYPNVVWHCSLNDPTYVSDLDYYKEGLDTAAVKGLVAGNNALWVFREPSDANTTVFYHTPSIDSEYGKVYPSQHSSVTTGCVGKAINFGDDIIFFSDRGMEGISGDITTEQVVAHRSSLVDCKMTALPNYKDMVLEEWEGYLFVFIGNHVFLADSRAMFTNENHAEYEWFYWQLGKSVTCARVYDGVLYIGTDTGVFAVNSETGGVESWWVTPKDRFKYPHKLKTTNKRGCVAEATGDITVYAKIEDTDFELIGEYKGVTDYFVSRIKRKKFKDIQLKFHSKTRFSIEQISLEAWIGGYIKR